jgi:hypothetical protein
MVEGFVYHKSCGLRRETRIWLIRPFPGTTACTCHGVSGASRRVSPVHARRNPLTAMCVEAHISYGAGKYSTVYGEDLETEERGDGVLVLARANRYRAVIGPAGRAGDQSTPRGAGRWILRNRTAPWKLLCATYKLPVQGGKVTRRGSLTR